MKKLLAALLCAILVLSGCALTADVSTLSGDDLVVALALLPEAFEVMSTEEKTAYTCACLELEIMNGGLCQFFANNPDCAAYVPEALEELGALDHLALYEAFLTSTGIDPLDPMFQTADLGEFSKLYDLYPWENFDDPYCALMPMPELLERYVQENSDFFQ